jgi:outer membrane protein insertion porin family
VSSLASKTKHVRTRFGSPCIVFLLALTAAFQGAGAQTAPAAAPAATPVTGPQTLCATEVVGNRRIPKESILARVFWHEGDAFDQQVVSQSFSSLWNTGYFEKIQIESEQTPQCLQLIVYVIEKPTIHEINYKGMTTVSTSDVLDEFKKEKVGLSVESQYDETKVARAMTVIKEMLAAHGHQYATIHPEVKTIPPAGVAITFDVKEGPTVKVGKIEFTGNAHLSDRVLRSQMHFLKPIGIPHSIILENLLSRTFDSTKLDEDAELVRQAYLKRGYFRANVAQPQTRNRDQMAFNPFTLHSHISKRVDILMSLDEGARYRLGGITFSGNKNFTNTKLMRAQFNIKDGDWLDLEQIQKGLKNLQKAYGSQGYINFQGTPVPRIDDAKKLVYIDIDIDEGKSFLVSRIEFTGNTITRDKVIRRELMLEEGQQYNAQLWELSILRLNQLNYFETLKVDQDSESIKDEDAGTVELLLKLKEKGKNSIGLNGGVSGQSGAFLGLNYETNNFLGLGETLSVNANIGDLSRQLSFGFTEPYLHDKPISMGVQVFATKFDYNPAKSYAITNGQSANLTNAQQSLLTNYNESSTGFTVSFNEPFRHFFATKGVARMGVSYSLSRASVTTFNDNTRNVFQSLAFRTGIGGGNQLDGIITSVITPSFSLSSLDRSVGPHSGKDLTIGLQVAGAGGNVKYFAPQISYRQYFPMRGLKVNREGHNVLGYRIQFLHVEGFGGEVAPPQNRIYGGGENDVRGFDIRASSPYTFIPNKVLFNLTNPDNSTVPRDPTNPNLGAVQIPIPVYRLVSIGGDTGLTANLQYNIPIASQVTFDFFADFGLTGNLLTSQLRQNVLGTDAVTSPSYGCPQLINGACFGGQKVDFPFFLKTVPHTNFVPRMSVGPEITAMMPIINAPVRIFYAYNPLRLYRDLPQQLAVPNSTFQSMFPNTGAGQFSYQQALQFYGANYQLREPRKTFRLTVATTF